MPYSDNSAYDLNSINQKKFQNYQEYKLPTKLPYQNIKGRWVKTILYRGKGQLTTFGYYYCNFCNKQWIGKKQTKTSQTKCFRCHRLYNPTYLWQNQVQQYYDLWKKTYRNKKKPTKSKQELKQQQQQRQSEKYWKQIQRQQERQLKKRQRQYLRYCKKKQEQQALQLIQRQKRSFKYKLNRLFSCVLCKDVNGNFKCKYFLLLAFILLILTFSILYFIFRQDLLVFFQNTFNKSIQFVRSISMITKFQLKITDPPLGNQVSGQLFILKLKLK